MTILLLLAGAMILCHLPVHLQEDFIDKAYDAPHKSWKPRWSRQRWRLMLPNSQSSSVGEIDSECIAVRRLVTILEVLCFLLAEGRSIGGVYVRSYRSCTERRRVCR